MKPLHLMIGAVLAATGVALVLASPAVAQRAEKSQAKTPDSFPYELRDGKRVPRGKRVTAADGSWREEIKDGECVTVREKSAKGEYRETRHC